MLRLKNRCTHYHPENYLYAIAAFEMLLEHLASWGFEVKSLSNRSHHRRAKNILYRKVSLGQWQLPILKLMQCGTWYYHQRKDFWYNL